MTNTYIFDTSVLISDPLSIKAYPDSNILIPITSLDEIDKLKKNAGSVGKSARVFTRLLDDISDKGDISIGVLIDNGAIVKVDTTDYPNNFGTSLYGDNRILACAYAINKSEKDVVLLTNDINLRIRGRAAGIRCEKYEKNNAITTELYDGVKIVKNAKLGKKLLDGGSLILSEKENIECFLNEFIMFVDEDGNEISKGRKIKENKLRLVPKIYPWGLSPRNSEQEMAIDLIMDNKLPLVSFVGSAGCGKSLIAIASALELVLNKKAYEKLIIYRPIQAVGSDIGYTPGSISEKLEPWFYAINDHFEQLMGSDGGTNKWKVNLEMYKKKDKIQYEAMTYIRGRSIPNAIILIDEVQNISKEDIKTILTRVGTDSKILLTGDIEQIDAKDLDATNNGLTYVIEKFKGSNLAGHITFKEGQRSALATEASKLL